MYWYFYVRTLNQIGKYENVGKEMERLKVNILGLSEVKWTGSGKIEDEDRVFYYAGGEKHEKGVGIMMNKCVSKSVIGFWPVSERVILVKISGHPFNMNIIQVYAPTSERPEEEVDLFYDQMEDAIKQCKSQDIIITLGDFNAKVGGEKFENVVGPFGLGTRNERGERLISWCDTHNLMLTNTWFRKHERLLWTWKSPGDRCRNQIDFITINKRFRNSITNVRTYPGADCYSDHVPVIADMKLKLKITKRQKIEPRRDLKILRTNQHIQETFRIEVENRYTILEREENIDGEETLDRDWRILQQSLNEATSELVPTVERRGRRKWITEEILDMMDERRINKGINNARYEELNREIKIACDAAK